MLWIITGDHISAKCCETLNEPAATYVGKVSTWNKARKDAWQAADAAGKDELRKQWIDKCDYEFRLYDDDGELYYEGVCLNLDDAPEDGAFEPLDWAMNDAGCTRMDYRKKGETEWKTL